MFALELDGGFPAVERAGTTFHWVTDPRDPLVDLVDEPSVVRAALARGETVSLAMEGERFAARLAVSLESFWESFMGVRIHLRAGSEAWMGEMHTAPELRRRGLSLALGAMTMNRLGEMGVRTLYASVEDWNEASRNATLAQGFVPVAEFRFLRVFRRWGVGLPGSAHPAAAPLVRLDR